MQREECSRWIANGLPRKGWRLHDLIDHQDINDKCEWCGTNIRFVHVLYHPEINYYSGAGCMCAEKLTDDYVNPRAREKKLKGELRKKISHKKKYMRKRFDIITKNHNLGLKFENNIIIFAAQKNGTIQLLINGRWGKRFYNSLDEARSISYEYLYGQTKIPTQDVGGTQ